MRASSADKSHGRGPAPFCLTSGRNTAVNIGNDASDVIGSIMKDYIDVPPTISIDQGAVVMVMVNADVEMF